MRLPYKCSTFIYQYGVFLTSDDCEFLRATGMKCFQRFESMFLDLKCQVCVICFYFLSLWILNYCCFRVPFFKSKCWGECFVDTQALFFWTFGTYMTWLFSYFVSWMMVQICNDKGEAQQLWFGLRCWLNLDIPLYHLCPFTCTGLPVLWYLFKVIVECNINRELFFSSEINDLHHTFLSV